MEGNRGDNRSHYLRGHAVVLELGANNWAPQNQNDFSNFQGCMTMRVFAKFVAAAAGLAVAASSAMAADKGPSARQQPAKTSADNPHCNQLGRETSRERVGRTYRPRRSSCLSKQTQ